MLKSFSIILAKEGDMLKNPGLWKIVLKEDIKQASIILVWFGLLGFMAYQPL